MKFPFVLLLLALPVIANERRVELLVPSMTCITCPLTVKTALMKVPGVRSAEVSYDDKRAVVTFNDNQTAITALTRATADAGYPSTLIKSDTP